MVDCSNVRRGLGAHALRGMDALEHRSTSSVEVGALHPLFEECKFYPHGEDGGVSERLFVEGLFLNSGSNMMVEGQERVIMVLHMHRS